MEIPKCLHTHQFLGSPCQLCEVTSERCVSHFMDRNTESWSWEVTWLSCTDIRPTSSDLLCAVLEIDVHMELGERQGHAFFSLNSSRPEVNTAGGFQLLIRCTYHFESSRRTPPEKEELGANVNQKPCEQTHLSELCEKREGCK